MMSAASSGKVEVAKLLVEMGANKDAKNKWVSEWRLVERGAVEAVHAGERRARRSWRCALSVAGLSCLTHAHCAFPRIMLLPSTG